ncbi:MAG: hypothetical protein ABEH83_11415 [Halobacterium sp.]
MLDTLADVPPVVVALSLVSTTLLGVAFAAQPSVAPRADALASTVNAVGAADTPGAESHPVRADAVRITTHEIAVRGDGGTARASFAYGPVVPVRRDTGLWRVLHGAPPGEVFDGGLQFASAAVDARQREAFWRHGRDRLTVRRVTWRGVDVTLVGA